MVGRELWWHKERKTEGDSDREREWPKERKVEGKNDRERAMVVQGEKGRRR